MSAKAQKKSTRAKKELSLSYLLEKMQKARSIVVTDYRGLSMAQLQNLRSQLGQHAEYTITKNTIFARALHAHGITDVSANTFFGPSAVLFSYADEVGPLKVLTKFSSTAHNLPTIKCGILGHTLLSADRVIALSKLPHTDQLRGKVVSTLAAPLSGLVYVLHANMRQLVYVLQRIKEQKV